MKYILPSFTYLFRLLRGGEPTYTRVCINITSPTHQTEFDLIHRMGIYWSSNCSIDINIKKENMKDNKDRKKVMAAVKQNGYALEYADTSLKKDREIVMAAIKQDSDALEYASEELQNDPEIKKLAEGKG